MKAVPRRAHREIDVPVPILRPRRLRKTPAVRRLVAEHALRIEDLIEPFFVVPGSGIREPVSSMPGVCVLSADRLIEDAKASAATGIRAIILFGVPEHKDEMASELADPNGPVQRAIRSLKAQLPDLVLIADLCACEYTSHGHCGIVAADGSIDNDRTLALLAGGALSYAECGVDFVAPSDMMDGRVRAVRHALDADAQTDVGILSYAVKYASALYGPFREAAQSAPAFGDRRTHQMDPPNVREAIREALLDVEEGADIIMVKPALAYLDVLYRVHEAVRVPVAAYSVSGEYSMVKAAVANGWIDEARIVDEMLVSMKRAGADLIVTYFAREAAARLSTSRA